MLPPPSMEITGHPTVTEGGEAVLQLSLSSNPFGSQIFQAHASAIDAVDGEVISQSTFMIEVADGQTAAEVRIPVDDDAIDEPTEFFTVSVDAADAIPYRFIAGGNLVTVLDNDGATSTDTTPPTVAKHRNVIVERSGSRPAWVSFSPPPAMDDVDGVLTSICNPGPMSAMPKGRSQVSCSATDSAGNTGSGTFQMTVRKPTADGSAKALGGHGDSQCVAPNEYALVTAAGFTPGTRLTIHLQSSSLEVVGLQTVEADRKGRVLRLVKIPAVAAGDADVVVSGRAGDDDLVRMLPLKVARGHQHHHGGPLMALLRNKKCD